MLDEFDQYIKPISTRVTTYCIQRPTPDIIAPVHLDEVGAKILRYIGKRVWTITIRCDAAQQKGVYMNTTEQIPKRERHALLPDLDTSLQFLLQQISLFCFRSAETQIRLAK